MYGSNCHNRGCAWNTGKLGRQSRCSFPNKKAFMLCEVPSRRQIERAREYIEGGTVIDLICQTEREVRHGS